MEPPHSCGGGEWQENACDAQRQNHFPGILQHGKSAVPPQRLQTRSFEICKQSFIAEV
jgi:hypothetical protein